MSDVRARVREAREHGEQPRLHPQGFLQLNLTPDGVERIHVWDDDVPRTADEYTVHDHVWDFTSHVLRGKIINDVYGFECDVPWSPIPDADWEFWKATEDRHTNGRGGKILKPTGQRAIVFWKRTQEVPAPRDYEFRAGTFHDTRYEGLTATLFRKGKVYGGAPRIMCAVGRQPDAPLPADLTPEFMWDKIDEATR